MSNKKLEVINEKQTGLQVEVREQEYTTEAARYADEMSKGLCFVKFREDKAKNTLIRHDRDLEMFRDHIIEAVTATDEQDKVKGLDLSNPEHWRHVTYGLLHSFIQFLSDNGYAVSTIDLKVSTIRVYSGLAAQAGYMSTQQALAIKEFKAKRAQERQAFDDKRLDADKGIRVPAKRIVKTVINDQGNERNYVASGKKQRPVRLSLADSEALKEQPATPQGIRDRLLICLLLDHGLRCGEVARLKVFNVDMDANDLVFDRPKVGTKDERHELSKDTAEILYKYFDMTDLANDDYLIMGSNKSGRLTGRMSERAISNRVRLLGAGIGKETLSPHCLRHAAAVRLAKTRSVKELMDIFGWKKPEMAMHYAKTQERRNVD